MNFIHALATIEPTLEKFRKKNEELEKDIPVLREVVESSWRKEPELTALKTDLILMRGKFSDLKSLISTLVVA